MFRWRYDENESHESWKVLPEASSQSDAWHFGLARGYNAHDFVSLTHDSSERKVELASPQVTSVKS